MAIFCKKRKASAGSGCRGEKAKTFGTRPSIFAAGLGCDFGVFLLCVGLLLVNVKGGYTYTCTYTHALARTYALTPALTRAHARARTYTSTHARTHARAHKHAHTQSYTHPRTHARTHTHTCFGSAFKSTLSARSLVNLVLFL